MHSNHVRDKSIYQMRTFLERSQSKLEFKAQNDPNLIANEEFRENLAELNQVFMLVK